MSRSTVSGDRSTPSKVFEPPISFVFVLGESSADPRRVGPAGRRHADGVNEMEGRPLDSVG